MIVSERQGIHDYMHEYDSQPFMVIGEWTTRSDLATAIAHYFQKELLPDGQCIINPSVLWFEKQHETFARRIDADMHHALYELYQEDGVPTMNGVFPIESKGEPGVIQGFAIAIGTIEGTPDHLLQRKATIAIEDASRRLEDYGSPYRLPPYNPTELK